MVLAAAETLKTPLLIMPVAPAPVPDNAIDPLPARARVAPAFTVVEPVYVFTPLNFTEPTVPLMVNEPTAPDALEKTPEYVGLKPAEANVPLLALIVKLLEKVLVEAGLNVPPANIGLTTDPTWEVVLLAVMSTAAG
jgi:hypothetical protein